MVLLLAGGISAGANLIGNLLNRGAAKRASLKDRQFARETYDKERRDKLSCGSSAGGGSSNSSFAFNPV